MLTSAVKRLDVAVFDTIEELTRGTLETGRTSRFSLGDRAVGLGTISAAVPPSLKAELEDVRAGILDGKIPVPRSVDSASLWTETQTVLPSREATSVGAWPTVTMPTTRPSRASIWTTVPSALSAASTTPSVAPEAHQPLFDRGRLANRRRLRIDAPDLSSRIRDPDTQLAGGQRDGSPMGTSAVAMFVCGSIRKARLAVVTTQSASSPSATPTGT